MKEGRALASVRDNLLLYYQALSAVETLWAMRRVTNETEICCDSQGNQNGDNCMKEKVCLFPNSGKEAAPWG